MAQQTVNTLLKVLDESVSKFIDSLPSEQKRIYEKVVELVSQLDRKNGDIKINVANQRLLLKISSELDKIIVSESYKAKVAEFAKVFDTVAILNNRYLAATFVQFKPTKTLEEIKWVNMEITVDQLTETGVGIGMKAQIMNVLKANINSGGSYGDLIRVLHGEIVEGNGSSPYMISQSQKIVIDAVNQYNAQYIKSVTDDLGLKWFQYLGSLLTTSRQFCVHMVDKRYFHISEVPALLGGLIDGKQIPVSKKTGLPIGMFDNTDVSNFFIYRGGHKCGHQIIPVATVSVPKELRDRFS